MNFNPGKNLNKKHGHIHRELLEFSRKVRGYRNKIILKFYENYQRGVSRKMKKDFADGILYLFKGEIPNIYDEESVKNFIEKLSESISDFYFKIQQNKNIFLDDGIIKEINIICNEFQDFLLDHARNLHRYSDTPRSKAEARNFVDIYSNYYDLAEDRIISCLENEEVFAEPGIESPARFKDRERINLEVFKVLNFLQDAFSQTGKTIDVQSLQTKTREKLEKIFYSRKYLAIDVSKYNVGGFFNLLTIFNDYIDQMIDKGEVTDIKDFLEKYDVYQKEDLNLVISIFDIKRRMKKNLEQNFTIRTRYRHIEESDLQDGFDSAWYILVQILFNMHDKAMLRQWSTDFAGKLKETLLSEEEDQESGTNELTSPFTKIVFDLLILFKDELEYIFKTYLINLEKNREADIDLSLEDGGLSSEKPGSGDTVH